MVNNQLIINAQSDMDNNIAKILSLVSGDLPLFPIIIMTSKTRGQVEVKYIDEIMQFFKESSFIDCRINAYPVYTGYNGLNNSKKQ